MLTSLESFPVTVLASGAFNSPIASPVLNDTLARFGRSAFDALSRSGAAVRFVESSSPDRQAHQLIDDSDALLVLGGADIDPTLYGQEREAETIYGVDSDADLFELELIRLARERGIPVLGICRGLQLLNVASGGTLVQELGQDSLHYNSSQNTVLIDHPVQLVKGGRLHAIYRSETLSIRSGHHQAIASIGAGLSVSAIAADGVIEAIESTSGNWMLGVQWHPEDPQSSPDDLDRLAQVFVANAAKR